MKESSKEVSLLKRQEEKTQTEGWADVIMGTNGKAGDAVHVGSVPNEETGHTPGPWRVDPTTQYQEVAHGYSTVAEAAMTYGLQRAIANAHLIAAAPDLLEACEAVDR